MKSIADALVEAYRLQVIVTATGQCSIRIAVSFYTVAICMCVRMPALRTLKIYLESLSLGKEKHSYLAEPAGK